jgi:hypothetical protein
MLRRQLMQASNKPPFKRSRLRLVTIGRPMLTDQLARPPLRHPMPPLQEHNSLAPARRAHQFPRCKSFIIWMSNA